MKDIGETAVEYGVLRDARQAESEKVFKTIGVPGENEDRHISELYQRMTALDGKETYITIKALLKTNKETFARTLHYLNEKEGEKH